MVGPTLRLAVALLLAQLLPGSARRRGGRKRGQRPHTASRAATWRRKVGVRGVALSLLPLNLPDHAPMTIAQQAAWVADKMRRVDFATIAECSPELARAINALPGLACRLADPNYGGNGNAIVVNDTRVSEFEFSDYAVTFTANSGRTFTLHMGRVRAVKGGLDIVLDAMHAPSEGHFKTSATDAERRDVFQAIARTAPKCDVHLVAGDSNELARLVLRALRSINRKWRHLGGSGVEQVYGLGAVVGLGQRVLRYFRASDHEVTAKVRLGALLRARKKD